MNEQAGGAQPDSARPSAPRPQPTVSTGRRLFRWAAAGLAVALVITSVAGYLKFRSVWDSIKRVSVTGLGPQPRKYTSAMNIMLIGSDTRSGANRRFGRTVTGQRSDTIIVLHIAPDGRNVIVLSIPRDSVVPILACPPATGAGGQLAQPGQVEQINATFAAGGPGCLWKTIEHETHLHLDHFIELNFVGFEHVINDLGGVSICLPFAISDPLSRLRLSAGRHHVGGAEALAFWRARYIGEGSDLQRIRRDQYLMASILQGAERKNLLSSPARILSVITDAARSMTTDSGLSLSAMISIVESLRSLPPGAVQFIELPTVAYGPNPNWVEWPASDSGLFQAIAHDRVVHPAVLRMAARLDRGQANPATAAVRVQVLSGSGVAGIAQAAASELAGKGFHVAGTGNAAAFRYETTVIGYPTAADRTAAATIKTILGGGELRQNRALAASTIQVIVGAAFRPPGSAIARGSAAASAAPTMTTSLPTTAFSPRGLARQYGGITGSANVCHDSTAFAGPNGGA